MRRNENPPPGFDLEKMTWKCECCSQQRSDKYIKVRSHDVGDVFDQPAGVMFANCKYCVDMPGCLEKASDRVWVINHFFPGKLLSTEEYASALSFANLDIGGSTR